MKGIGSVVRFFLAGLLTVGALVLLFIGSFGDPMTTLRDLGTTLSITTPVREAPVPVSQADQPVPAAQPAPAPAPQMQANVAAPPAAPSPAQPVQPAAAQPVPPPAARSAPEHDALAEQLSQMRDQLAAATRQVTTLRAQADQEQQDLQKLQQQRAAAAQGADQARQGSADEAAARARRADELSKQVADQQATLQQLQAQSQQATSAGKQEQVALQKQIAAQQAQLDQLKADTAQAEALRQRQQSDAVKHPAPAREEAAPRGQVREAAQPPAQPPQKVASASKPPAIAKPQPTEPDDRQQVLQRLRHETARPSSTPQAPVAQVPSETTAQPAPEPIGPPPQERLLEARNAAAAGRIDEARHLLQQAQVQLVLRPVSPRQSAPAGGSVAAGQVAEALSMLDAGDLPHAIQYINLAVAQAGWPREITASSAPSSGPAAYYPR